MKVLAGKLKSKKSLLDKSSRELFHTYLSQFPRILHPYLVSFSGILCIVCRSPARFELKGENRHIWDWTNIGDRGKLNLHEDSKEDIDTAARNYSLSFNRDLGKKEVEKRYYNDNSHLRRHVAISN
jgi:hypothetical protein